MQAGSRILFGLSDRIGGNATAPIGVLEQILPQWSRKDIGNEFRLADPARRNHGSVANERLEPEFRSDSPPDDFLATGQASQAICSRDDEVKC